MMRVLTSTVVSHITIFYKHKAFRGCARPATKCELTL